MGFGLGYLLLAEAEVLPAGAAHDEDHGEADEHELVGPLVGRDEPEVVLRPFLDLLLYLLLELFPILTLNSFQIFLVVLHYSHFTFSMPSK